MNESNIFISHSSKFVPSRLKLPVCQVVCPRQPRLAPRVWLFMRTKQIKRSSTVLRTFRLFGLSKCLTTEPNVRLFSRPTEAAFNCFHMPVTSELSEWNLKQIWTSHREYQWKTLLKMLNNMPDALVGKYHTQYWRCTGAAGKHSQYTCTFFPKHIEANMPRPLCVLCKNLCSLLASRLKICKQC